jgi:predicted transcriptional regulator
VYSPRIREDQTQRQLVGDLVDRVFGGSAARMVMQALATKKANPEELAEIRHMLDEFEQGGGER